MSGTVNLSKLTKEQLIHLVVVRGQALKFYWEADRKLVDKLDAPGCVESIFDDYWKAKETIGLDLMVAEEQIIGGGGQKAN